MNNITSDASPLILGLLYDPSTPKRARERWFEVLALARKQKDAEEAAARERNEMLDRRLALAEAAEGEGVDMFSGGGDGKEGNGGKGGGGGRQLSKAMLFRRRYHDALRKTVAAADAKAEKALARLEYDPTGEGAQNEINSLSLSLSLSLCQFVMFKNLTNTK